MAKPIVLVTNFFRDRDAARYREYCECLRRNLENPVFTKLFLLVEEGAQDELLLQNEKIVIIPVPRGKQKYSDFVSVANTYCAGCIVVFSNSDIYFDNSLQTLQRLPMQRHLYCLTRREVLPNGIAPWTLHQISSDAWVTEAPVQAPGLDIQLGKMHCESLFVGRMHRAGYRVENISLDVSCYHLHITNKRNYDSERDKHTEFGEMMYPCLSGHAPGRATEKNTGGPIVVDAAVFQCPHMGDAPFWHDLLKSWSKSPFGQDLVVMSRARCFPPDIALRSEEAPIYNSYLISAGAELNGKLVRRLQGSMYVSTLHTTALGVPNVVVALETLPEYLEANLDQDCFTRALAFKTADVVLCQSEAAKALLEEKYQHRGPSRFFSLPLWFGGKTVLPALDEQGRNELRQRLGISKRYVVVGGDRVGTFCNKNLKVLADELWKQRDIGVLFIGGSRRLEPDIEAMFSGLIVKHMPDAASGLAMHLAGAEFLVQPALGEEESSWLHIALACGVPALRAAWSPKHSAGGGVHFFDPFDPMGFSRAFSAMLRQENRRQIEEEVARRVQQEVLMSNPERLEVALRAIQAGQPVPDLDSILAQRAAAISTLETAQAQQVV